MPGESLLTPEVKAFIGQEAPKVSYTVDRTKIIELAEALGDPNPLWNDEVQARKTSYGGLVGSPTLVMFMHNEGVLEIVTKKLPLPTKRMLNGGDEIELFEPMRPGDRITVGAKLAALEEKTTKTGTMVFCAIECTYVNQFDELVARTKKTIIRY